MRNPFSKNAFVSSADLAIDPYRGSVASLSAIDPLLQLRMSPNVIARRAQLAKVVKGIVFAALAICVVAVVRVGVSSASEDDGATDGPAATKTAPAKTATH